MADYNGIQDLRSLQPGQSLKVPPPEWEVSRETVDSFADEDAYHQWRLSREARRVANQGLGEETAAASPTQITRKQYIAGWGKAPDFRIEVARSGKADPSAPLHEIPGASQVGQYDKEIMASAQKHGVDPDLIRAIMHIETTHGWYDAAAGMLDMNKSILPMNINTELLG